jgi:hypothetical protein
VFPRAAGGGPASAGVTSWDTRSSVRRIRDSAPAPVTAYLSFFSRVPVMAISCFWPPNSAAPFPFRLSPSIVSV